MAINLYLAKKHDEGLLNRFLAPEDQRDPRSRPTVSKSCSASKVFGDALANSQPLGIDFGWKGGLDL
jgi:hypothetical protein